jgi:phage terminase large subunit-like protein
MPRRPLDPVTQYATDVVKRKVVANYAVTLACQRHLRDLREQEARGLTWQPAEAQRAIDFFGEILCLPEETDSDEDRDEDAPPVDGTPFVLQPWQAFIVGALMGWYTARGFRRFRDGYVEIAKGAGKTPLGAGLMLYLMVADGEFGAQVFFAAVTKDQARIAFADAEKMVNASPHLRSIVDQKKNNLAVLETGSFLRAISSERRGLDGKRVHGALIDELHEASAVVVNKMRRGTKGRRNALILRTTNSGFDRSSACWHQHVYSLQVLEGSVTDESWFAYICGLDPCKSCRAEGLEFPSDDCPRCDDWRTEGRHWLKACPNLGVSVSWQYYRELVRQAKAMPSEVSSLLRFNFCVWTQQQSRYLDMLKWHECPRVDDEDLQDLPCYGGLDLGQSDDLCAFIKVFVLPDGRLAVRARFWLPEVALQRFPNRPYEEWQRDGSLEVTEGDITDYGIVEHAIVQDSATYGIRECAFDKRFASQMAQNLQGHDIKMIDMPQGYGMNEALRKLSDLVATGQLAHGHNPVLTQMAANAVVRHGPLKQLRLDKERSADKIDGIAALAMVLGWIILQPPDVPAEDPVLIVL